MSIYIDVAKPTHTHIYICTHVHMLVTIHHNALCTKKPPESSNTVPHDHSQAPASKNTQSCTLEPIYIRVSHHNAMCIKYIRVSHHNAMCIKYIRVSHHNAMCIKYKKPPESSETVLHDHSQAPASKKIQSCTLEPMCIIVTIRKYVGIQEKCEHMFLDPGVSLYSCAAVCFFF
jgi:hypothetical protein